MSQPFKLYRLQQIDSQIDWTRSRVQEVERLLKDDETLRQSMQHADDASQNLQQARKSLRQAEQNVQQQRLKIEQNEATLYGGKVRNPKELQDLQNEIASLKRYLSVLEDRQLEAMFAEEEASSAHQGTCAGLDQARARFDQQSKDWTDERSKLLKEIARSTEERDATVTSIPPQELSLYESLRRSRRGIAVAKVTDRACSACGSTLNAVLLHAARSPNQITLCDICGRILYTG